MIQTYLEYGQTKPAVFEFFVRKLLLSDGSALEQAFEFLESLHQFDPCR